MDIAGMEYHTGDSTNMLLGSWIRKLSMRAEKCLVVWGMFHILSCSNVEIIKELTPHVFEQTGPAVLRTASKTDLLPTTPNLPLQTTADVNHVFSNVNQQCNSFASRT